MNSQHTKKAIYAATPHKNWVTAAELLRDRCGLKPVYWESPSEIKSEIEKSFPEATVHNVLNATKGVPPDDLSPESPFKPTIDSGVIEDFADTRIIALKMMDRIDPGNVINKKSLGYNERVRHYYRLLSYWIEQFDRLDPEVVIFGNVPHLVNDYILYSVAKNQNVNTIIFRHTSLPQTFYLTENISDTANVSESNNEKNLAIPGEIRSYIDRLRSDYSEGKPSYMGENNTDVGPLSVLKSLKTHFLPSSRSRFMELLFNKNFLRWNVPTDITYNSNKVEESEVIWTQWLYFLIRSRIYLRNMKNTYGDKARSVSLSREYIYFPLHYQPERTTSPEGGYYVDQTLVADLLSNVCEDVLIYVKEHPSQFDPQLKGQLGRKEWQYEDIIANENIRLVPIDTDPYELIDNALAVATVTGTAGWEAINRGVPALVFGSAWYSDAPGVHRVRTQGDLEMAISSIKDPGTWEKEDIYEFIRHILSIGYRGKLNEATSPGTNQAETIYQAVSDWISN